jgi:hypothetical protein
VDFVDGCVIGLLAGGIAGYAFRGAVGRELKQIAADATAEAAKLVSEAKAELTKLISKV